MVFYGRCGVPMRTIQAQVAGVERHAALPPGTGERFSGYGIMSLPFNSGHVLALRRFPVTSIGPGYTSVWHRSPSGAWTFYTDVPPGLSCPRYFGSALESARRADITMEWTGARNLEVRIGGPVGLDWSVQLAATPVTRLMTKVAGAVPDSLWGNEPFLKAMGAVSGPALRAGRIGLSGAVPNRQGFRASPRKMWVVAKSRASLGGEDFGAVAPLRVQTRLGDFWMPQRGIFMVGSVAFEPFDPERHLAAPDA